MWIELELTLGRFHEPGSPAKPSEQVTYVNWEVTKYHSALVIRDTVWILLSLMVPVKHLYLRGPCRRSSPLFTYQKTMEEKPFPCPPAGCPWWVVLFLWAGLTTEGVFKRHATCKRFILEDLAYVYRIPYLLLCCFTIPAINFSEAKLPGNRFAISDKLACFCSTIDSHNENSVINVVFFFCLCARKLRAGNLCSVICIPLYPTDRVFSVSAFVTHNFISFYISGYLQSLVRCNIKLHLLCRIANQSDLILRVWLRAEVPRCPDSGDT